MEERLE